MLSPSRAAILRRAVDVSGVALLVLGESLGANVGPYWAVGPLTWWVWLGAALLILRQIAWPKPSLMSFARALLARQRTDPGTRWAWSIALASRLLVLMIGFLTVRLLLPATTPLPFRVSDNPTLNLPARFDAGWYLGIARHGYDWSPELRGHRHSLAFFPAFPIAMRVAGDLVTVPAKVFNAPGLLGNGNSRVLWGGVLVSIFCFGVALCHVYKLALWYNPDRPRAVRAIALLSAYPFALFFSAPYSESLFLMAASGAILAWVSGEQRLGFAWGLLAGLARSNGWTMAFVLLADFAFGSRERRRAPWLGAAFAPLLGAAMYCIYVYGVTGNPFEWATAQAGWGGRIAPVSFLTRRWDTVARDGLIRYITANPVDALTLAATLFAVAIAAWCAVRREWLFAVWILAYLAPALAIDLQATGRMTAVLAPLFIVSSRMGARTFCLVLTLFGAGQAMMAIEFFSWRPPF